MPSIVGEAGWTDVILLPIGAMLGSMDFLNMFIDLPGKGMTTLAEAVTIRKVCQPKPGAGITRVF
jgi:hypothetical protein